MSKDSLPSEGQEVFVTVGTAFPREKRAIVRGVAQYPEHLAGSGNLFKVDHKEMIELGDFAEAAEFHSEQVAVNHLNNGESGPYGPGLDEEYGEVWAFSLEELEP